ncbi:MAG: hypothetical protein LIP01_06940 [Tannerellaceae bacterium]|nr:hypothetical protein [Tannerellaceae bacterium]
MKKSLFYLLAGIITAGHITGKNQIDFNPNPSLWYEQPKTLRILYIGDSITDGNWGGGNNPSEERNHWDWNHLYGSGYVYLCVAHFMGYYPENEYIFFNRGISGNTVEDMEKRWQKD